MLGAETVARGDSEIACRLDAMREAVARADAIIQELLEFSQPDRPRLERTDDNWYIVASEDLRALLEKIAQGIPDAPQP